MKILVSYEALTDNRDVLRGHCVIEVTRLASSMIDKITDEIRNMESFQKAQRNVGSLVHSAPVILSITRLDD